MCCARALVSSVREVALLGLLGGAGAQKGAYGYCAGLSPRWAMPGASTTPPFAARLIPGVRKGCALAWGREIHSALARGLWSERAVHAGLGWNLRRAGVVVGSLLCFPAYPGVLKFQRLSRHKRPAPRCAGPLHLFQGPLEFCAAPGCFGAEQCCSAFGSFL